MNGAADWRRPSKGCLAADQARSLHPPFLPGQWQWATQKPLQFRTQFGLPRHAASHPSASQSSGYRPMPRHFIRPRVHLSARAPRWLAPVESHYNECRCDRLSVKIESAFCCLLSCCPLYRVSASASARVCATNNEQRRKHACYCNLLFRLFCSLSSFLCVLLRLAACCECVFLRKASRHILKIKRFLSHDLDEADVSRKTHHYYYSF